MAGLGAGTTDVALAVGGIDRPRRTAEAPIDRDFSVLNVER